VDPRRKQLLFRSHHCGMKENDILLGHFADRYIAELSDQQLNDLDTLMQQNDIDVMNWIIGKTQLPDAFDTDLMSLIQRFNKTA
jgi:antitoxin CptB